MDTKALRAVFIWAFALSLMGCDKESLGESEPTEGGTETLEGGAWCGDTQTLSGGAGTCDVPAAHLGLTIWGPTEIDSQCVAQLLDGSCGGYAYSFHCPEGEFELSFDIEPELPAGIWAQYDSYDVKLRRSGESFWLLITEPSGELFLAGVRASMATPPDEPKFFAPLAFEISPSGCGWDPETCSLSETASVEITGIDDVGVSVLAHSSSRVGEGPDVWTGEVAIGHASPDCPDAEPLDRLEVLVVGGGGS